MTSYLIYGLLIAGTLILFNRLRQGSATPGRRNAVNRTNPDSGSDTGYYNSGSDGIDRDDNPYCHDNDTGNDSSCDGSDGGGDGGGGGD